MVFTPGPQANCCPVTALGAAGPGAPSLWSGYWGSPIPLCLQRSVFSHTISPSSLSFSLFHKMGSSIIWCNLWNLLFWDKPLIRPYPVGMKKRVNLSKVGFHPPTAVPLCSFIYVEMIPLPYNLADSCSVISEASPFACTEMFAELKLNVYLYAAFYTPAIICMEWFYRIVNWGQFLIVNKNILGKTN